jgi:hypothetical protein
MSLGSVRAKHKAEVSNGKTTHSNKDILEFAILGHQL